MLRTLYLKYDYWRAFRPFDTFICAYPKTGNTWTRVFLGRYAQTLWSLPEMPLFDQPPVQPRPGMPKALFTHAPLEWDGQTSRALTTANVVTPFARGRVVVLVRHPLDTLLSSYMQLRTQVKSHNFSGTFTDFVDDPNWGLEKYLHYYNIWSMEKARTKAFLLQRYEDARVDPRAAFHRLIDFLGMPLDAAAFDDALAFSDFSSMQAMEKSGRGPVYKSSGLNIFASDETTRQSEEGLHVRKGKVSGYIEHLDAAARERFEDIIRRRLPAEYGYG
ncbi:MAG: sulfotransferase domain-containing protein [Rhodospirillaceae bacterium]